MFVELRELLCSEAIRRHQLRSKAKQSVYHHSGQKAEQSVYHQLWSKAKQFAGISCGQKVKIS